MPLDLSLITYAPQATRPKWVWNQEIPTRILCESDKFNYCRFLFATCLASCWLIADVNPPNGLSLLSAVLRFN